MSEVERDASVAKTVEIPTEDMNKDILPQTLQNCIHFEKIVSPSNAANFAGPCSMALPTWFVVKHGDKFQTYILRSGSSTEPWRVQLNVGSISSSSSRLDNVKLSSGWKRFATANGLIVGDWLVFCLRAKSEFDVYVFRETRSPTQPSSIQAPRKRLNDFELSKARVNKSVGPRSRNLVADRCAGRVISKTEEGKARTGSRVKETPVRDWQERIFFETTLTPTATSTRCRLRLPQAFVKQHGDKIHKHTVLQSVADRKSWTFSCSYFRTSYVGWQWLEGVCYFQRPRRRRSIDIYSRGNV